MTASPSTLCAPTPDPLSEILHGVRLTGIEYGRSELRGRWSLAFAPGGSARFHFVAEGAAWLQEDDGTRTRLTRGDIVVLPRGEGHALDGEGPRTLLYCGHVGLDDPSLGALLGLLPTVLHLRDTACVDPVLPVLLETMAAEVREQRLGAATVLARLADVVVARVLRAWVEACAVDTAGWLAAIRDPQVGRALVAMHRSPGRDWSLEALAREAHASRSAFAERFASTVGMPPARYLARWRMHLATGWLREGRLTVAQAASRLGYDSEHAFSRAFRRVTGASPGAMRRRVMGAVLAALSVLGAEAARAQAPADTSAIASMQRPGPEAEALARRTGSWRVTMTLRGAPDAPPVVMRDMVAERRMVGQFLHEEMRPAPGSAAPDFRRIAYLHYNRVEGRWQYVSLDTRFPAGVMPAWSHEPVRTDSLVLAFEPLGFVGFGGTVEGRYVRSNLVLVREGDAREVARQYWTRADGTGARWLAVEYVYERAR